MIAFIFAAIIEAAAIGFSLFWAFAESMATAPRYDNAPFHIFGWGTALSVLVGSSHWWAHHLGGW
jgi:hypothetical protein